MSYKPVTYTSVAPYLIVTNASATIDFLTTALSATEVRRMSQPDGRVMHAEMLIDDTIVMLSDAAPPEWPAVPAHVHVYLPDVDVAYRRALEAGAESIQEPIQKGDEDKRGGVRDAGGTTWWISTKVQ